jgi:diguanylate cyclase (GGDEF)-like protein
MSLVEALPQVERRGRAGRGAQNVIQLKLPPGAQGDEVMGWAMAQVAEAERRVAALQERIAYLESLSVTDELTGLLNRRGFVWELRRTLATAKRGGPHGILLMCDLDGFKGVNDCFGHAAGDEVLRRTGAVLSARTRRSDVVARIGGDEFAIVLVGASLAAARKKGQCLAASIAKSAADAVAGERIGIGVSFGYAAFAGEEGEEDLLAQADIAMYGAKRRNRAARGDEV